MANFSDAQEHKELEITQDAKPSEVVYKEKYDELRRKYPGGMNSYEKNWVYQLTIFLVILGIGIANLRLNFLLIDVYDDLINDLKNLPEVADLNQEQVTEFVNAFEALDDTSGVCDYTYFGNEFNKQELERSLLTVQRFVKAAAYMSIGFFFWFSFLTRAMTAYNLCTEEFNITGTSKKVDENQEAMENGVKPEENGNQNEAPAGMIKVAGGDVRNQETLGEKKIRTYLRSETILFGINQTFQDIPIATACVLYFLFLLEIRGVLCYQSFTAFEQRSRFAIQEADGIVIGQLIVIVLNVLVNLGLNVIPRWIAYFNNQIVKHAKRPKSTTIRVVNIGIFVLMYLLAIFLPLFVTLYSPVGTELLGLNTTNSLGIMVLIIFSAACLAMGSFFFCCHWGTTFMEGICVCTTVLTAFELGCDGCFNIEIFEFCEACC